MKWGFQSHERIVFYSIATSTKSKKKSFAFKLFIDLNFYEHVSYHVNWSIKTPTQHRHHTQIIWKTLIKIVLNVLAKISYWLSKIYNLYTFSWYNSKNKYIYYRLFKRISLTRQLHYCKYLTNTSSPFKFCQAKFLASIEA